MSQYNLNKKNKLNFKDYVLRGIGLVIFILVLFFAINYFVKSRAFSIKPFYVDSLGVETLTRKSLIKKVYELNSIIQSNNARISRIEILENENQKLKKELGRSGVSGGILANVLTIPNRSIYDTFIIDAGAEQGIAEGMNVYAFDAIALGTISEVYNEKSLVTLFSQSGRETVGNVVNSEMNITLVGRGAGEYEVRMPRDIAFAVGDKISFQSINPTVLAEIKKIMTDPRDPFQRLLAKTPMNLVNLKWVIVK